MRICTALTFSVGLVLVLACAAAAQPAAPTAFELEPLAAEQLVYRDAQVVSQVDVNGEAAIALVGSALDALAAEAEEQIAAVTQGRAGAAPAKIPAARLSELKLVAPLIGPVKEAIKSLSSVTLLVMRAPEKAAGEQVIAHYREMMGPLGWVSLLTVRGENGAGITAMLGPEGKGVFFAVAEKQELVVGMVTTARPLGDLIGEIVTASRGLWPSLFEAMAQEPAKARGPAATKPKSGKPSG